MELKVLENWLFEAANILRGPVDQSDYKAYIFPLLFLKRISDVYDEEKKDSIELYGEDFKEEHRFIIPEGCHWENIRDTTVDVGQKISIAMREIEKTNSKTLYGIFGDTQWTNKEKLPDYLLNDLIEHFSQYKLSNKSVTPTTMGDAYEYLIKKFADLSNKKAGEFYTPRSVVRLMTMMLDPKEGMSVYDPACGTGGMLLEAIDYLKSNNKEYRSLKLFGNEKNLTTSAIAKINMFLHDLEDFSIVRTDTLKTPVFYEKDKLKKFDLVIANPPFSLKKWGVEEWKNDERNSLGVLPPHQYGDFAWVLHMIHSLNENGKMAVVLPHGVLFRVGREQEIRKKLVEIDYFEAVIGLAPNLFYGTNIPTSILILNKNKPIERKESIQFIDASEIYKADRAQNYLLEQHIEDIFKLYTNFEDIKYKSKIMSIKEIKNNGYNLNITRYVEQPNHDDEITMEQAYLEMLRVFNESVKADEAIIDMLKEIEGVK